MSALLQNLLGPRIPRADLRARPGRFLLPALCMVIGATLILLSFKQQYWSMTLYAPQYPKGLHVQAHLNRLTGDVAEIDGLNHYIGMRPLNEAAQLERETAWMVVIVFATLIASTLFIHTKWAAALALPAILFPAGFLLDLYFWLHHFGNNLDPKAALSSSIKPFTPPVLGEGLIGQFRTVARVDTGWYMAAAATFMVLLGLFFHRRAFKPLHDLARTASERSRKSDRQYEAQRRVAATIAVIVSFISVSTAAASERNAIQRMIDAAEPGTVVTVPAGNYGGTITIDRSITLQAQDSVIIDGGGHGDVVRITATGVTFRGFSVRGSGTSIEGENAAISVLAAKALIENNTVEDALFGISLKSAPDCTIRGNTVIGKRLDIARRGDGIRIWQSHRALVEDNTVRDSRDVVMWFSDGVALRRNTVSNSRYGLHFMYTHDNLIEENRLEGNSVGAFLMYSRNLIVRRNVFAHNRGPSGYGLGLKDMQGVLAEDNVFVGNRVAAYLDNPPTLAGDFDTFTRNLFAHNDLGLAFQPMVKQMAFTENSFVDNMQQVAIMSSGAFGGNKFAVDGKGNYWSDYRGFDLDQDGIGDLPFNADNLFENLMEREPSLRLFIYSPAQQAIELAAKAFPIMRPDPKVTDDAPLMRVAFTQSINLNRAESSSMWFASIGLLAIGGVTLLAARPQFAAQVSRKQRGGDL